MQSFLQFIQFLQSFSEKEKLWIATCNQFFGFNVTIFFNSEPVHNVKIILGDNFFDLVQKLDQHLE